MSTQLSDSEILEFAVSVFHDILNHPIPQIWEIVDSWIEAYKICPKTIRKNNVLTSLKLNQFLVLTHWYLFPLIYLFLLLRSHTKLRDHPRFTSS